MAKKTSKAKPVEKFELCFSVYDSSSGDATKSREVGLIFERVGKTSNYKPVFVMHNVETGLRINLPLPEGNYEKLCSLFDGMDASTVEGYVKKLMMMLTFVRV